MKSKKLKFYQRIIGIGLASENGKSRFAIRADVLDVVSPDGTKRPMFSVLTVPQTINGVLVQKGVYLDSAYIANGSIDIVKINKASIQSLSALSGVSAGTRLEKPAYGCVVVFSRNGGGHVGFVVGKDRFGNLMVLGGNQGDAVNIKPFAKSRVLAYRWCGTQSHPAPHRYELPVLGSDGRVSRDEA